MSLPTPDPSSSSSKADPSLKPDPIAKSDLSAKTDGRTDRWGLGRWGLGRGQSGRWFALVVLLSAGLHGVGLLVPIPEKQEVIEKEEVLPEPIQVSTLPLDIPELPEEPAPLPVEPPPPPPELEPQIVIEQPAINQLPAELPTELFEEPPVEPVDDPPVEPVDDPPVDPPPKDPDPKTPDPPVNRQGYDATGTTDSDSLFAYENFFGSDGLGTAFGLDASDVNGVYQGRTGPLLSLAYPAEANSCFEEIPSLSLTTSVMAIVGDFEDNSGQNTRAVIDVELTQKTGYEVVDNWLSDVVAGSVDTGIDIYDAIATNSSEPLLEVGSPEELFSFKIIIELPDQPCN